MNYQGKEIETNKWFPLNFSPHFLKLFKIKDFSYFLLKLKKKLNNKRLLFDDFEAEVINCIIVPFCNFLLVITPPEKRTLRKGSSPLLIRFSNSNALDKAKD